MGIKEACGNIAQIAKLAQLADADEIIVINNEKKGSSTS